MLGQRDPYNARTDQKAKQGVESSQPEVLLNLRRAKSIISINIGKYIAVTQKTKSLGCHVTVLPLWVQYRGTWRGLRLLPFFAEPPDMTSGVYLHWLGLAAEEVCPLFGHDRIDEQQRPAKRLGKSIGEREKDFLKIYRSLQELSSGDFGCFGKCYEQKLNFKPNHLILTQQITEDGKEFEIAHSVVSRLWKSFKTTGMCSRRHGGGRVRNTTPAEDRYIVLSTKRNRRTTDQQVANQFFAASGKQISRKTVARHLRGGGLYARRPVVCVLLTRRCRTARLQWCSEHHNWTEQDWACVLFSDESRFSLSSYCRRQQIWRESGTAYRPENIQEKDGYPTCSIMMWAGIMINGRTRLHVVANGTMKCQRYIDEVLLHHVRLFRGADCLDSEGIQRLVWPARSPDLNPFENVRDALGRQVAGRNYPPTNKNTLIRALTDEWDKLPQQLLDNVVQSMKIPEGYELANMVANDLKMVAKVTKLAASLVDKNYANLALPPRFRQVLIESPL
ncbi:transposable element Tcb1 transposase [Trichonephila clavipes]|nr:transposable element Tcb1 transposase [Trichonephila clavipes]